MSLTDEIKERLEIVAFVEEHGVQLRKVGRAYQGFCPFHENTRTPAFTVYPDTRSFYCFGCGASGTVFDFLMRQDGLNFAEALEKLAIRAGVDLAAYRSEQHRERDRQRERLLEITTLAARYFNYLLAQHPRGKVGRDYLAQRGVDEHTQEVFQLGYALNDWGHLLLYLTEKKGYPPEEVEATGLVVQNEHGGYYDRFRGRIIFPIRNERGEIVGFGGRILPLSSPPQFPLPPKYLNTPQTLLFDKGQTLYGLDQARETIRKTGEAILVEGYLDVIAAYQYGFPNVVAPLGTALTRSQVDLLKRYTRRVIFALDADSAGRRAIEKGIAVANDAGEQAMVTAWGTVRWTGEIEIRVARLPEGTDPDTLIRKSPEFWQERIADATPLVEYWLEIATSGRDMSRPQEQQEMLDVLLPVIGGLGGVQQAIYASRVAHLVGLREETVLDLVRSYGATGGGLRTWPYHPPASAVLPPNIQSFDEVLLALLLRQPDLLDMVEQILSIGLSGRPYAAGLLGREAAVLFERTDHQHLVRCLRDPEGLSSVSLLEDEAERLRGVVLPPGDERALAWRCTMHLRMEQVKGWSRRVARHVDDALAVDDEETFELLGNWIREIIACLTSLREHEARVLQS